MAQQTLQGQVVVIIQGSWSHY